MVIIEIQASKEGGHFLPLPQSYKVFKVKKYCNYRLEEIVQLNNNAF